MTDQLCAHDAYLPTCDATVLEVRPDGVVLDRTVFYAQGGGQPGDTGVLRWAGHEVRVIDTTKSRDDGAVLHALEPGVRRAGAGNRGDAPRSTGNGAT